jgi:hypothetical protein
MDRDVAFERCRVLRILKPAFERRTLVRTEHAERVHGHQITQLVEGVRRRCVHGTVIEGGPGHAVPSSGAPSLP